MGGTEQAEEYTFFYGKENENHQVGRVFCTSENSIGS
jgi:hypothetical protein